MKRQDVEMALGIAMALAGIGFAFCLFAIGVALLSGRLQ